MTGGRLTACCLAWWSWVGQLTVPFRMQRRLKRPVITAGGAARQGLEKCKRHSGCGGGAHHTCGRDTYAACRLWLDLREQFEAVVCPVILLLRAGGGDICPLELRRPSGSRVTGGQRRLSLVAQISALLSCSRHHQSIQCSRMQASACLWRASALPSPRPRSTAPRQPAPRRVDEQQAGQLVLACAPSSRAEQCRRSPRRRRATAAIHPRRRLLIYAAAAADGGPFGTEPEQAQRFHLGQPPGMPELESNYRRDEEASKQYDTAAAAAWRPWAEQQYAALQPVAGSLTSFTAVSWQRLGPAAGPLRLADFLPLLDRQRLQEVTLVLSEGEPLPADALGILAGYPQLHSLAIQSLGDDHMLGTTSAVLGSREADAAAALSSLTQLTSLIERQNISHPVMEAIQQLPQLECLCLAEDREMFKGTGFASHFPSLRHFEVRVDLGSWSAPLPRPADFTSLESYEYTQECIGDYCTLWVSMAACLLVYVVEGFALGCWLEIGVLSQVNSWHRWSSPNLASCNLMNGA